MSATPRNSMKEIRFAPEEREEWLYIRRGKITGSRLKDVYSKRETSAKKIGYYELIAEKLGLPPDTGETALERGSRLEADAVARFKELHPELEIDSSLLIWAREDNENIAISPDAVIGRKEAIEAKCLSSARHIEAFITKKIPDDYEYQALQYFIVNDELETLHFIFYDPRFSMFSEPGSKISKLDYFEITLHRADVAAQIEDLLTYERKVIAEVNAIVNKLTF